MTSEKPVALVGPFIIVPRLSLTLSFSHIVSFAPSALNPAFLEMMRRDAVDMAWGDVLNGPRTFLRVRSEVGGEFASAAMLTLWAVVGG